MNPATYAIASKAASNKYTPILVGVVVVGTVIATYFIGRKVLETFGVVDTKFDRRIKYLKGFDPNYYKTNLSRVTISTATAQKIADDVYYSYGFASSTKPTSSPSILTTLVGGIASGEAGRTTFFGNDDEQRLVGSIQSAGSEFNLSKVSDVFQKKYGKNMIEYIFSFADNTDTEAIYKIIKSW